VHAATRPRVQRVHTTHTHLHSIDVRGSDPQPPRLVPLQRSINTTKSGRIHTRSAVNQHDKIRTHTHEINCAARQTWGTAQYGAATRNYARATRSGSASTRLQQLRDEIRRSGRHERRNTQGRPLDLFIPGPPPRAKGIGSLSGRYAASAQTNKQATHAKTKAFSQIQTQIRVGNILVTGQT
jgi:hypothetical protein